MNKSIFSREVTLRIILITLGIFFILVILYSSLRIFETQWIDFKSQNVNLSHNISESNNIELFGERSELEAQIPELKSLPEIDPELNWKIYINEKYGYKFRYPEDWHMAYYIMEWYMKNSVNSRYVPQKDDWIMFTNLTEKEEKDYLKELESYRGIGSGLNHVDNADGRIIFIRPTSILLDDLKDMQEPGFRVSDVKESETKSSLTFFYFRRVTTWEMNKDEEVALIPYPYNITVQDSEKVTFIELAIERNNSVFNRDVFYGMIYSFNFLDRTR